ncbi:MAG: tetratricopeptide repeat protein [Bacteroidia bacterium]
MKTTMFNNCLTFDQLQAYALNKSDKLERDQTYKHISTCELCACAVNGFTAIPFSFSDVDAIHNQIDVKTNATHANPLTFARVTIVIVALASIFGFYQFANSFSKDQAKTIVKENDYHLVSNHSSEAEPNVVPAETQSQKVAKTERKNKHVFDTKIFKNLIPVEPVKSLTASLPEPVINNKDIVNTETFNSDVIYIYDLKVTEYQSLYFNQKKNPFEMKGNTPSYKENKDASNNLAEPDITQVVAADRVLKKGLEYFNRGKYTKAIIEFQILLDINSDDVNSLFYSGVSYYQIGKYNLALKNLGSVLQNDNNVFHPEAKWNLALVYLKLGDRIKAKQLLSEIVNEKGFYSNKASEKLKGL